MKSSAKFALLSAFTIWYLLMLWVLRDCYIIDHDQTQAGIHLLWLIGFVMVLWLSTHRKVLILLLAMSVTVNGMAQDKMPFKLTSAEDDPQPQFTACEFACGAVVIIVGGYIIYRLCTARFWANIPPPPPRAAIPPVPPTNAPPITNTSAWCPIAVAGTNPPTVMPQVAMFPIPVTPDLWGNGGSFDRVYYGKLPGWQSSTNLRDWSDFSFSAWASSAGTLSVVYDGAGSPVVTNYVPFNPMQGAYVPAPTGFWIDRNKPATFFRWHD